MMTDEPGFRLPGDGLERIVALGGFDEAVANDVRAPAGRDGGPGRLGRPDRDRGAAEMVVGDCGRGRRRTESRSGYGRATSQGLTSGERAVRQAERTRTMHRGPFGPQDGPECVAPGRDAGEKNEAR